MTSKEKTVCAKEQAETANEPKLKTKLKSKSSKSVRRLRDALQYSVDPTFPNGEENYANFWLNNQFSPPTEADENHVFDKEPPICNLRSQKRFVLKRAYQKICFHLNTILGARLDSQTLFSISSNANAGDYSTEKKTFSRAESYMIGPAFSFAQDKCTRLEVFGLKERFMTIYFEKLDISEEFVSILKNQSNFRDWHTTKVVDCIVIRTDSEQIPKEPNEIIPKHMYVIGSSFEEASIARILLLKKFDSNCLPPIHATTIDCIEIDRINYKIYLTSRLGNLDSEITKRRKYNLPPKLFFRMQRIILLASCEER